LPKSFDPDQFFPPAVRLPPARHIPDAWLVQRGVESEDLDLAGELQGEPKRIREGISAMLLGVEEMQRVFGSFPLVRIRSNDRTTDVPEFLALTRVGQRADFGPFELTLDDWLDDVPIDGRQPVAAVKVCRGIDRDDSVIVFEVCVPPAFD
jgi:hypothetical protein